MRTTTEIMTAIEQMDRDLEAVNKPALLAILNLISVMQSENYNLGLITDILATFDSMPATMQKRVTDSILEKIKQAK